MITVTFIFGSDAVTEYNDTDRVPSKKWISENGGSVVKRTFSSDAELNAYLQALRDLNGWSDYCHTTPIKLASKPTAHKTTLQFRTSDNLEWRDFPAYSTVDKFNNDFSAEFMHGYYSSDNVAWEDDMQRFIDGELSYEDIKERRHEVATGAEAEVEMKRLRQIILNETFSDFFSDLTAGKIEFRRF